MDYILLLKVILAFIVGGIIFKYSRNARNPPKRKPPKGVKRKERGIKLRRKSKQFFNTTQIVWENEDTKKYLRRLVEFDKFKPLKIEMKFSDSYVLPKRSQLLVRVKDIDSGTRIESKQFERFCYSLFFHPYTEKLCGAIRFNERCCGPSKINDQLEENCVNGGATLTIGIEMMEYFIKILGDGNMFTNEQEIELSLDDKKLEMKLKEVEIEYIRPIPLHNDYRLECGKMEEGRYEVRIIGMSSLREEYAIIRGIFEESEEEGMYNVFEGDDNASSSSIDQESYDYLKNDEIPPTALKVFEDLEAECVEGKSGLKPLHLQLYKSRKPTVFRIGALGDKYVVPQYYLIGEKQKGLGGSNDLLSFGYVMVRAFHNNKMQQTTLVMFFGCDTADPMNQNQVHLGAISTTLDNYAALHVNMCVYPMMICTSFTKVLTLEFNQDLVSPIKRYEFVKLVFNYQREREVMMPTKGGGKRKAVYGTVQGELLSLDEKKKYAKFEALFTSLEQNRGEIEQ